LVLLVRMAASLPCKDGKEQTTVNATMLQANALALKRG
jgi:hypothetical protein